MDKGLLTTAQTSTNNKGRSESSIIGLNPHAGKEGVKQQNQWSHQMIWATEKGVWQCMTQENEGCDWPKWGIIHWQRPRKKCTE